MEAEFNLARLLAVLAEYNVKYILIGGTAAIIHGSPFPTEDADITPDGSAENLAALSAALTALNARIRVDDIPEGLPFTHSPESLKDAATWNLVTDAGILDIAFMPSGTMGYADLRRDAVVVAIHGSEVAVASLPDIIRSKQAANRPKDQRVLPTLRELLSRRRD